MTAHGGAGNAQAAWKEQTGGLRLEGESLLLRKRKNLSDFFL